MRNKEDFLDRLYVAGPCKVGWDELSGDNLTRHCDRCDKRVYDISRMTRSQAKALVASTNGQLCARITRLPDGTILTMPALTNLRPVTRNNPAMAAAVLTAVLTINSGAMGDILPQSTAVTSVVRHERQGEQPHASGATGTIAGTIADVQGAVIAGASVTLTNQNSGKVIATYSSDEGKFIISDLDPGLYTMVSVSPGFAQSTFRINLEQENEIRIDIQLTVSGDTETLSGVVAITEMPLRSLFKGSELIVAGRVGKTIEIKKGDKETWLKTAFNVQSTLKGKAIKRTIYVYRQKWGDEANFAGDGKEGDQMLLFLNMNEEFKGYEVNGYTYGAKKLSDGDLAVIKERIGELPGLTARDVTNAAEIVEWLVNCAEDPATRWDGASELLWSAERGGERSVDAAAVNALPIINGTGGEKGGELPPNVIVELPLPVRQPDGEIKEGDARLFPVLSAGQKERLARALYSTIEIKYLDLDLVRLVEKFKDERLLPFLISQLRRVESNSPPAVATLIEVVAEIVDDEQVSALADYYNRNATYEELLAEQEESESEATDEEEAERDEGELMSLPSNLTPTQRRSLMLRKFLAEVEAKLARRPVQSQSALAKPD